VAAETFRRVCMSFDAWVVGFGCSRTLIELGVVSDPAAYAVLATAAAIDVFLLYQFFAVRRRQLAYELLPAASSSPGSCKSRS
jgi:hypothetical protein